MNLRFTDRQSVVALVFIGLGLVLLMDTLNIVPIAGEVLAAIAFMAGGALFLGFFLQDQRQWWTLFPAFALGSLGLTMLQDELLPRLNLSGPIFLGGVGLSFLTVYALRREHWWPLIPGGVLMTLAAVTTVDTFLPVLDTGWLFFLGLALTFGAVYALGGSRKEDAWALIAAAGCGAVGLLTIGGFLLKITFPLLLVTIGLFLLLRPGQMR